MKTTQKRLKSRLTLSGIIMCCILTGVGWSHASGQTLKVSGVISESVNAEPLMSAAIVGDHGGVLTDENGFYTVNLRKGQHRIVFSCIGYNDRVMNVNLSSDTVINVTLTSKVYKFEATTLNVAKRKKDVLNKEISVVSMDIKDIKSIPVIFGEVDVLKTITLMPGIQSGGEGSSGLHVRGGGQDQNLILLDGATIYNPAHLMGFFSVFNGGAISGVTVYKGGIPANYGGRLASVIDVEMKEGNAKKIKGEGGVGTISSKLTLEGPIFKKKATFLVSGRRSYIDLFAPLAPAEIVKQSKLYFYDVNFKLKYKVNDKNKIYVSGYSGKDVLRLGSLFGLNWGNMAVTARWNHVFNKKLVANTSLVYTDFDYGFDFQFDQNTEMGFVQNISDYSIRSEVKYYRSKSHNFSFGGQALMHRFNPGTFDLNDEKIQFDKKTAFEPAVYVQHIYKGGKRLKVTSGMRYVVFANMGGTYYRYKKDESGEPLFSEITEEVFKKGEISNLYQSLEPRLSVSYKLNSSLAIKSSYNRTSQFIQQASNTASPFPTDQWFSSNKNVKPQFADQVALGLFAQGKSDLEASVEVYYKKMKNQIDYRDGANLFVNEYLDAELLFGNARSFGSEFHVSRSAGKFKGFLSYTLAHSLKQIKGINNDKTYPTNYDVRHNLSIVMGYELAKRWSVGGTFVFMSGKPITIPVSKYYYDGQWNNHYGERNGYRVPNYHRMDVSLTYKPTKKDKRWENEWNLSVYNAYNRANTYAVYFPQANKDQAEKFGVSEGETIAVKVALFKAIPSISWNFKF